MSYANNLEHLLEELHRIDLIVRLNLKSGIKQSENPDYFQGLYISENEVNEILQKPPFKGEINSDPELVNIEILAKEIYRKKIESINQGIDLRLHILSELFHLQPFEVDVLLICLAPELDLRYEKLYSYMQNDVTKKRPTVDLVLRLLCSSIEEKFKAREYFSPALPLVKNRLLYLTSDGSDDRLPLLSKSTKVDERIISFLLGTNRIDPRIQNFSLMIWPEKSFDDLVSAEDDKAKLIELIGQHSSLKEPLVFLFSGPYGTGKKMTAEAVCRELGMQLLVVDSKALVKDETFETLKIILREALLQNSSVYFEGFDVLWKNAGVNVAYMIQELDCFPNMVFLSGEQLWEPSGVLKNHGFIGVAFPLPTFEFRKRMWKTFLKGTLINDLDVSALASKFKFSGGQIKNAISSAQNLTEVKGIAKLSLDTLYHGCKMQSNRRLSSFARKIEPRYAWEDIVLPEDTKKQLKEVCGYIKHRGTVYTDWGFDRKLSLGKGLNVLFSGPSGTGKTMAAEIIARDAELDLYEIDLSGVVSKYIGETEKNLKNIFKEAETSNAILFFDEADALFGKRSEVKDSHDRYANIEISYLLQKMEEYEGVAILATNLYQNLDEAFKRRLQAVIEFPFPDEEYRRHIWEIAFPKEAPLGNDVDFGALARNVCLAGGNIKNMAIAAAFYAAENGNVINMQHLLEAARREYQKLGRTWDELPYSEKVLSA